MNDGGIYCITNTINGKVYVGSSINIKRRWREHRYILRRGTHINSYLQRSWDKYGKSVFEFSILEYITNSEDLRLAAEQKWMDTYRSEGKELYNVGLVAYSAALGYTPSKETRKKMSESHKGIKLSKKHCQSLSKAGKGRTFSQEHRRRISNAMMGHKVTKETRQKISKAHKGIINTAKPFPAFVHKDTGEIIPAGMNLSKMCRRRGLLRSCMCNVSKGKRKSHQGWVLLDPAKS